MGPHERSPAAACVDRAPPNPQEAGGGRAEAEGFEEEEGEKVVVMSGLLSTRALSRSFRSRRRLEGCVKIPLQAVLMSMVRTRRERVTTTTIDHWVSLVIAGDRRWFASRRHARCQAANSGLPRPACQRLRPTPI